MESNTAAGSTANVKAEQTAAAAGSIQAETRAENTPTLMEDENISEPTAYARYETAVYPAVGPARDIFLCALRARAADLEASKKAVWRRLARSRIAADEVRQAQRGQENQEDQEDERTRLEMEREREEIRELVRDIAEKYQTAAEELARVKGLIRTIEGFFS